jgi:hypothetical protein
LVDKLGTSLKGLDEEFDDLSADIGTPAAK